MTDSEILYIDSGLYKSDLDFNKLYDLSIEELQSMDFNETAIKYIKSLRADYEDKGDLVSRLKVRDGFVKPILNFASSDFQIIFNNVQETVVSIMAGIFSFNLGVTTFLCFVLMILFRIFFVNVLKVGYSRFFLENSKYHKTTLGRLALPFRENYKSVCNAMALKTLYQFLWNFTIIGGIIKLYSYRLVSYIVAEDSTVSARDAIKLSQKLMKGYKWKAFLLDTSMIGWKILGSTFMGLIAIFFVNPYVEGTCAEFYKALIKERKGEDFYKEYLNGKNFADEDLYVESEKLYYPNSKPSLGNILSQKYSVLSLILLFFFFAFVGWVVEVSLFLVKTHSFVNRGTLYGPWLPIYGIGCILILLLFTKTRLKKYLTQPAVLFFMIMLICGIMEYTTSFVLELITGLKYWDYAGHFLNINGRVCLENLCHFGLGGLLCVYLLAPNINSLINKFSNSVKTVLIVVLVLLFSTDAVYTLQNPRTGYGVTGAIIDEYGNIIDSNGNKI